jgi:hypothetical protein
VIKQHRELFTRVLVDAGPLVAIYRRQDEHHEKCVETLNQIVQPLFTTWPVIAEAAYLLRDSLVGVEGLLDGPANGLYRIVPLTEDDLPAISALVRKYRRLGPQVADISLVHVAGRDSHESVFTLDRRDFSVYRTAAGKSLEIIPKM